MRTVRVVNGSYPDLVGLFGTQPIPTPLEFAIGAVSKPDGSKAISHYLSPEPRYFGVMPDTRPGWWDSSLCEGYTLDQGNLVHVAGPNGMQVVQLDGTQGFRPPTGQSRVNPNACTFIGAVRFNSGVAGNKFMVGPSSGSATGQPYVIIAADRVSTTFGGAATPFLLNTQEVWLVVLVGFSVARGMTMRINGAQVLRNPANNAPLDATRDMAFWAGPGTTAGLAGRVGHGILADVDLTAPEYSGDLAAIEGPLCEAYGVA